MKNLNSIVSEINETLKDILIFKLIQYDVTPERWEEIRKNYKLTDVSSK